MIEGGYSLTKDKTEKQILIEDSNIITELFGKFDENVKIIEDEFEVELVLRNGHLVIVGDNVSTEIVEKLIYNLMEIIYSQKRLNKQELRYTIELVKKGKEGQLKDLLNDVVCITASGKTIKPKTIGQKIYIDGIRKNDIVFGIGPAGTGKTYLAMAMAVTAFKNKEVNRIILTRPAVEAGESLGFCLAIYRKK